MSNYIINGTVLTEIADAIREKAQTTNTMTVEEMPTIIKNIQAGENVTVSYSNQYLKFYYTYFSETGELINNTIDFLDDYKVHSDSIPVVKNSIFIIEFDNHNSVSNISYSSTFNQLLSTDTIIVLQITDSGSISQRSWGSSIPL